MGAGGYGAAAGLTVAGTVWSALAQDAAGVYNQAMAGSDARQVRAMAEYDAKQLDDQAVDAINRGELEAQRIGKDSRALLSEQRAGLAGQGVDVAIGSAADIQTDTMEMSDRDQRTLRLNAMQEARGFRTEAARTRLQGTVTSSRLTAEGRAGRRAAGSQATGTLLTGGAQAISLAAQGVESRRGA